jgi:hypothetical protein
MKRELNFRKNRETFRQLWLRIIFRTAILLAAVIITPKAFGQFNEPIVYGPAGKCLSFAFHPDYETMVIYPNSGGTGDAEDFWIYREFAKWYPHITGRVKYLIIEQGITRIAYRAFMDLPYLEYVYLTHHILGFIDDRAFFNTSLRKIAIPQSVSRIGYWALGNTPLLKEIASVREQGYDNDEYIFTEDAYESSKTIYVRNRDWHESSWMFYKFFNENHTIKDFKYASGLTLDKTSLDFVLPLTSKATLTATVYPTDVPDNLVRWYSDNPDVVYVSPATGQVVARSAGTANITAYANNCGYCGPEFSFQKCQVTVRNANTDASLTSFTVNEKTYPVQSGIYYMVTLPTTETEISITGTPVASAKITKSPDKQPFGEMSSPESFTITVTAEDEKTEKTYVITVRRPSTDNTLESIKINDVEFDDFMPDILNYTYPVTNSEQSVRITVKQTDDSAKLLWTDKTIYLTSAAVTDTITVTAEDGSTRDYTITIRKKSTDATLKELKINNVDISTYTGENFQPEKLDYEVALPYSVPFAAITGVPNDPFAAVPQIQLIDLNPNGDKKTVPVTVTSEDADSTKTYQITLRRKKNIATLSELLIGDTLIYPGTTQTQFYEEVNANSITISAIANTNVGASMKPGYGGKTVYLNDGDNIITLAVLAEDSTIEQIYTITITRKSRDATLSSFKIDGATINGFTSSEGDYTEIVRNNISSVFITAEPTSPKAKVLSRTGNWPLSDRERETKITVKVAAENELYTKDYTVTVTRQNNNVALSSVKVNEKTLTSSTTIFRDSVPNATVIAKIEATAVDTTGATVITENINLEVGNNVGYIKVLAEDKSAEIYQIQIRRRSNDATLRSLSVDGKAIPGMYSGIFSYKLAEVPNDTKHLSIEAIPNHSNASVFSTTGDTLKVGDNTIVVTIAAEDTAFKQDYTIAVRRLSNDATLSGIKINGKFISDFSPERTTYTISDPYTTSVRIEGIANDSIATVTIINPSPIVLDTQNSFFIRVISEDKTATKTYTVVLILQKNDEDPEDPDDPNNGGEDPEDPDDPNNGGEDPLPPPSGLSKVSPVPPAQVYLEHRNLHVSSPVAERIYVYSFTGELLGNWNKREGKASFSVERNGQLLLIVKGSSGWSRKLVVSD